MAFINADHGAPTRFLDFTYSPYVAAYFAFEEKDKDSNAAIWAVNIKDLIKNVGDHLKSEGIEKVSDLNNEDLINDKYKLIVLINPKTSNMRSFLQASVFLKKTSKTSTFVHLIKKFTSTDDIIKFIISFDEREEILYDLNRMRINRGTLFPNIDNLAKSLKILNEQKLYSFYSACYFDDTGNEEHIKELSEMFEWLIK